MKRITLPKIIAKIKNVTKEIFGRLTILLTPKKLINTFLYRISFYAITNRKFYGVQLGGGVLYLKNFLNIDANPFANCDVISGIQKIKLSSESTKLIYASHVFEHIPKKDVENVLKEWYRILVPGGKVFIMVPNLEVLCKIYLDNLANYSSKDGQHFAKFATDVMFGGQINKYDFHYQGYSFLTIKALLTKVGFSKISRFEPSDITFTPYRDGRYAAINNTLVSLNVVAEK